MRQTLTRRPSFDERGTDVEMRILLMRTRFITTAEFHARRNAGISRRTFSISLCGRRWPSVLRCGSRVVLYCRCSRAPAGAVSECPVWIADINHSQRIVLPALQWYTETVPTTESIGSRGVRGLFRQRKWVVRVSLPARLNAPIQRRTPGSSSSCCPGIDNVHSDTRAWSDV